MNKLKGKVIIVTGASSGIGAALVRQFAKQGANVVMAARRGEKLDELVVELQALPGRRVAVAADLQKTADCQRLIDGTLAIFGRVDILINNAGLGHRSLLSSMPISDAETMLDTNLLAPLRLIQLVLPQMRLQKSGQIVNVSSIVGQRPLPRSGFYCATKTALNFVTRSLRMELRGSGISIATLYPGMTATDFHEATLGSQRPRRIWGGVSADKVARVTARAIGRRKSEIYVTWYDFIFTHLNRLFPRTIDWLFSLF